MCIRDRLDVLAAEPLAAVEYVSAANAQSLAELHEPAREGVLLSLAVRIGRTRLIDNLVLLSLIHISEPTRPY